MALVRILIPLACFIFLFYLILSQIFSDKQDKTKRDLEKAKIKSLDIYIQDLKEKIALEEEWAEKGVKEAEANLKKYKRDLDVLVQIKDKTKHL